MSFHPHKTRKSPNSYHPIDELEAVVAANLRRAERVRQSILKREFATGIVKFITLIPLRREQP
ncbi:MAG: hypothetical protein ACREJ6_09305 [Candidatus Methylomirabilis sp.]